MERYAEYKDSGVEWIGEIPAGWRVERLKWVGETIKGSGIKRDDVVENGLPCIRYGELYTTYGIKAEQVESHISQGLFDSCAHADNGDLLIALTGGERR